MSCTLTVLGTQSQHAAPHTYQNQPTTAQQGSGLIGYGTRLMLASTALTVIWGVLVVR
jgi:hypothetical protein